MTSTVRWSRLSWWITAAVSFTLASFALTAQQGRYPIQDKRTPIRAAAPLLSSVRQLFTPLPGTQPSFVMETSGMTTVLAIDGVHHHLSGAAISVQFDRASHSAATLEGLEKSAARVNYFVGNDPARWRSQVPLYAAVRYRNLYPGIDMVYRSSGGLKSEFVVAPGADPDAIRMRLGGVDSVFLHDPATLVIRTATGELRDERLVAFQTREGRPQPVPARFRLHQDGSVGFDIGAYDRQLPLLIDPAISYSSYLGGTRIDNATSIAVGADGSAYIAGWTESNNFPVIAAFRGYSAGVDGFVAKINPAGAVEWATYLGGIGEDRLLGIGVGPAGAPYVVGYTTSVDFPAAAPIQANKSGGRDAVIAKINASGSALVYSTFFGGSGTDTANGIAVDPFEQAYVVGETDSSNFPTRFPYQASRAGLRDAWTLKINLANNLSYATYFGGSGDDRGMAIALSPGLKPSITGCTTSTNLPVANAAQPTNGGGQDAFVTRFSSDVDSIVYSTYLGGSGGALGQAECAYSIAMDAFSNAYVGGATSSRNFPLLTAFQATYRGGTTDGFVTKLNSGGNRLYSSYLGGSNTDWVTGIRVDSSRRAYVTGYTASTNFTTVAPIQASHAGIYDGFLTRVDTPGTSLNFSTFLGGSTNDVPYGLDITADGDVYLTGISSSPNFPLLNQFQSSLAGAVDSFITKISGF